MIAFFVYIRGIEVLEKMAFFFHMFFVQGVDRCFLWGGGLLLWVYIQYGHDSKVGPERKQ